MSQRCQGSPIKAVRDGFGILIRTHLLPVEVKLLVSLRIFFGEELPLDSALTLKLVREAGGRVLNLRDLPVVQLLELLH